MDETSEPTHKSSIMPAISFRLTKLMIGEGLLKNVPTYVSEVVSDGAFTSIDGRLNGQPFHAAWPVALYLGHDEQPIYLRCDFPQQSVRFYERTSGNEGPAYAINYTNKEAEERSDERRKVIRMHLHENSLTGRYVFDTDPEIDMEHLERLQAIAAYLKPTINIWHKIGKVNARILTNLHGSGTLESLVVPQNE